MKKILGLAAVAVMFASSMFAFSFKAAGARLGANFGLGTTLEGDLKKNINDSKPSKKGGNIGFNIDLYGMFDIYQFDFGTIYLQPELDFNFNNGYNYKIDDKKGTVYTHTLDLPVLVTLQAPLGDMFEIGGGIGPQFSIPLKTDGEYDGTKTSSKNDKVTSTMNFGMVIDVNGKAYFGANKNIGAVVDMRYNLDFTKTKFRIKNGSKTEEEDYFTRRFLSITAGAEYRF